MSLAPEQAIDWWARGFGLAGVDHCRAAEHGGAPRKRVAAMLAGRDIPYALGEGHPLLGRRMPDLDLVTANGPLRVFTLLHDARPEPAVADGSAGSLSPFASTESRTGSERERSQLPVARRYSCPVPMCIPAVRRVDTGCSSTASMCRRGSTR